MTWLLTDAIGFFWLLTAVVNTLVFGRELKPAIEKRRKRLATYGEFEPEFISCIIVVTTFLLNAPYFYFRYTNNRLAMDLMFEWTKFRIRRRERRHGKEKKR